MKRYLTYGLAAAWLSVCSMVYGAMMWLALMIATTRDLPLVFFGTEALRYSFLLLLGAAPLFLIVRDQSRK